MSSRSFADSVPGQVLDLIFDPRRVFAHPAIDSRAAMHAICVTIALVLLGWQAVHTRVLDLECRLQTQSALSGFQYEHAGDDDVTGVERGLDDIEKQGEFQLMLTRVTRVSGGPVAWLMSAGLLIVALYVWVAVSTGKPKTPVLAGIVMLAGWVVVLKQAFATLLLMQLSRSGIEGSLAALVDPPKVSLGTFLVLRRLDPFDALFWLVICQGLWMSGQTSVRSARWGTMVVGLAATAFALLGDFASFGIYPPSIFEEH